MKTIKKYCVMCGEVSSEQSGHGVKKGKWDSSICWKCHIKFKTIRDLFIMEFGKCRNKRIIKKVWM